MNVPTTILFLMFAALSVRADTREIFTWRAPLVGVWTNDGIYRAEITLPVWDGAE